MRYSYSDRVAQMVERDASNIKVVSSILTVVKVFFTFMVEMHSLESTFPKYIYIYIYILLLKKLPKQKMCIIHIYAI